MHCTVRKRSNYSRILFTDSASPSIFIIHRRFHTTYSCMSHVRCISFFFPSRGSEYLLLACAAEAFLKWKGTNWCKCEDVIGAVSATLSHPPLTQAMSDFPDYYAILSVTRTASTEEIRTAYKKESLRCAAAPLSSALLIVWCLILAVDQNSP